MVWPTAALLMTGACTPTIKVEVAPISIYAKLDADVRIKLDKEVQTLIQQNPNLF
ncbi:MAG: YnbE family lipoprotein [Caulobacteraceae bacterium]